MAEATAHGCARYAAEAGVPAARLRTRARLRAVTTKRLGIAAAVLAFDAALLLIVGAAMWSEPPFEAEEAVGKGLMALGAALAIPAFVMVCAFLNAWATQRPAQEESRSDWDVV